MSSTETKTFIVVILFILFSGIISDRDTETTSLIIIMVILVNILTVLNRILSKLNEKKSGETNQSKGTETL